jgi:hypothetical protein
MNSKILNEWIEKLRDENKPLSFDESYQLASVCNALLSDKETEVAGRDLIIRTLNAWNLINPKVKGFCNDLIDVAGLHPYVDEKMLGCAGSLRHEYHKARHLPNTYYHEEQVKLINDLEQGKNLIVSAPTSFGKSLLIREVVAARRYKNIVIIQPTLALLDETRQKLQPYQSYYKLIVSTKQSPGDGGNIFLFTGERVVEYVNFPKIDFFVIDEFYKLSLERDDERAAVLNQALLKLLRMKARFYLLGPSIRSIPPGLTEHLDANWFRTDFATVAVDIYDIKKDFLEKSKRKQKAEKEKMLFQLLDDLKEPTLIYCSAPSKVSKLVAGYMNYKKGKKIGGEDSGIDELIEWINESIHKDWFVKEALKKSIGIHHGALPRHLASSIVSLFNEGKIRYLFCTSTLIEGVNTSAKNVVLFDREKGKKSIDYFDFKNISGRAGRMKEHYIGRVFQFTAEPKQDELDIDIPLFTQKNAPLELLVQLDEKEILSPENKELVQFNKLDEPLKKLIRSNAGASIRGQMNLMREIQQNIKNYYRLMAWVSTPNYEQLTHVVDLAWRHLLKEGESKGGVRSPGQLAVFALKYSSFKSIKAVINDQINSQFWINRIPERDERTQEMIHLALQVVTHWFDYKLPKWLSVVSQLQNYIFEINGLKPGNYSYFEARLASDFLPEHLMTLAEFGIPASAIRQLEKVIRPAEDIEDVFKQLKEIDLEKIGLLPYELNRIRRVIK